MPEISVIVPVYNVEKYIADCIESILAQTFSDFELILIDDGSTDNSGKICNEYAEKDSRIKVLQQKNQGQAAARNYGVSVARGKWVHFVDGDDLIHPLVLQRLYSAIRYNNVKISMCGAVESENVPETFFEISESEFKFYEVNENYLKEIFSNIPYRYWVVFGKLIDIDIVRRNPFTCGRVYEDNAVVFQWLYEAHEIVDTDEKLYFYRINYRGTTKGPVSHKKLDFLWALTVQVSFYKKIRYFRMVEVVSECYMVVAASIYNQICNALNDKKLLNIIRWKIFKFYLKNRKYIKLQREQRQFIFGVFHSRLIKIWWYIEAMNKVVKEEGIVKLLKKIKNKIL